MQFNFLGARLGELASDPADPHHWLTGLGLELLSEAIEYVDLRVCVPGGAFVETLRAVAGLQHSG